MVVVRNCIGRKEGWGQCHQYHMVMLLTTLPRSGAGPVPPSGRCGFLHQPVSCTNHVISTHVFLFPICWFLAALAFLFRQIMLTESSGKKYLKRSNGVHRPGASVGPTGLAGQKFRWLTVISGTLFVRLVQGLKSQPEHQVQESGTRQSVAFPRPPLPPRPRSSTPSSSLHHREGQQGVSGQGLKVQRG